MDPVRKSWNDTLGDFWSLPTAATASPPSIESDKNFDLNFKDKNLDIFGKKCTSRHKRSSQDMSCIYVRNYGPLFKVTETRKPHSLTICKRYQILLNVGIGSSFWGQNSGCQNCHLWGLAINQLGLKVFHQHLIWKMGWGFNMDKFRKPYKISYDCQTFKSDSQK